MGSGADRTATAGGGSGASRGNSAGPFSAVGAASFLCVSQSQSSDSEWSGAGLGSAGAGLSCSQHPPELSPTTAWVRLLAQHSLPVTQQHSPTLQSSIAPRASQLVAT